MQRKMPPDQKYSRDEFVNAVEQMMERGKLKKSALQKRCDLEQLHGESGMSSSDMKWWLQEAEEIRSFKVIQSQKDEIKNLRLSLHDFSSSPKVQIPEERHKMELRENENLRTRAF